MTAWPPLTGIRWDDTHRLILATYGASVAPFVADLADGDADTVALLELGAATNARLAAQAGTRPGGIGPHELLFDLPYSHIVNAAFTYPGPAGARFHGRRRGAWYAAVDVETSLAEVAYHRAAHLAECDWWDDVVDYRDYLADVHGTGFADLRGRDQRSRACLDPDSYLAGQELAERLLAEGGAGVVYPSVRHRGGRCVAVFRPALVGHVRAADTYELAWSGPGEPTITRSRK